VTFTTRRETCPSVILNDLRIARTKGAKYLGLHVNCRLNWRKHMFTKRKQLGIQLNKIYCSAVNCNCRSKITRCYTRQSLNPSGLMASNYGAQTPIQILQRKQIPQNHCQFLGTSPMTLYIMISTYHTLETRLKNLARDTPIGWRNIVTYSRLIS